MINAFTVAASQPWAIEPGALENVLKIADRMGNPESLATKLDQRLENTRRAAFRNGVAIIPVSGPIFRHAGLLTDISGATATGTLALDFQVALDNKLVHTIVFDIDSPGGEVTGIQELADHIYAARSKKTIKAYIGGMGASAAYWFASATSQIIVAETAIVGSIGVVTTHLDTKQRDEKEGIRRIEIVSSASPEKRLDPSSEAGRSRAQALVDGLGNIFVRSVARNRGVSEKKVLSDFGKGYVMTGGDAVRVGMADGLGNLEDVIAGRVPNKLIGQREGNSMRVGDVSKGLEAGSRNLHQAASSSSTNWDEAVGKLGGKATTSIDSGSRMKPVVAGTSSAWDSAVQKVRGDDGAEVEAEAHSHKSNWDDAVRKAGGK